MNKTTPSREDYLEAILDLSKKEERVRSIDIASLLGFSRASVSRAMSLLKRDGYIDQEPYGQITLTEKGRLYAKTVRKRHNLLKYFLIHIVEVDEKTAEADACKLEHVISEETLKKIEILSVSHMEHYHALDKKNIIE